MSEAPDAPSPRHQRPLLLLALLAAGALWITWTRRQASADAADHRAAARVEAPPRRLPTRTEIREDWAVAAVVAARGEARFIEDDDGARGWLAVSVRSAAGEPVAGALVRSGECGLTGLTDDGGVALLPPPPGGCTVFVEHRDGERLCTWGPVHRDVPGRTVVGLEAVLDCAPRRWVGVEIRPGDQGAAWGVVAVTPGSPADRAGIRPGDVITAVDGELVADLDGPEDWLSGAPGREVRLELQRGEVALTLGAGAGDTGL